MIDKKKGGIRIYYNVLKQANHLLTDGLDITNRELSVKGY